MGDIHDTDAPRGIFLDQCSELIRDKDDLMEAVPASRVMALGS